MKIKCFLLKRKVSYLMVFSLILSGIISSSVYQVVSEKKDLSAWWKFEKNKENIVRDSVKGINDELLGNYRYQKGVSGQALKFDGYTTVVVRKANDAPLFKSAFTLEAWIAIAAYPWNWCPIISQQHKKQAGYSFEIGPKGELKLAVFAGNKWHECIVKKRLPWKEWVHVTAVFDDSFGITLFINGQKAGELLFTGKYKPTLKTDLILGMNHTKQKASHVHRDFGTLPSWFALDAILDEVKIFSNAQRSEDISKRFKETVKTLTPPEIPPRIMPSVPEAKGRFGAYYTRLNYFWEWDDLWRVGDHPDIVVQFDDSPVRVVFWRGTRYSPAWISENNLWMADQSVEAWNNKEGCFEHMQDPRCTYSHVRIIENNAARVVVHWRYAPVSSHNNLWKVDEKTGWACWIDEYYYFFPDQTGIRKVIWKQDSLGNPRQFQESLPFTHPGQLSGEVINADYVTVSNLKGETQVFSYVENPEKKTTKHIPENLTLQQHNLKSKYKPFIIFEKGNNMHYLRDRKISNLSGAGLSHWPVGQLPCDGRVNDFPDRATHFLSFPVSDPPIHEGSHDSYWIASLYGMTDKSIKGIIPLAKSWSQAPEIELVLGNYLSPCFDISQRAYIFEPKNEEPIEKLEFKIKASEESFFHNANILLKRWEDRPFDLFINGKKQKQNKGYSFGAIRNPDVNDLIIWLNYISAETFNVVIKLRKTGVAQ